MLVDLASNSYLGLHAHPAVLAAAHAAIDRYGVGATAGRPSAAAAGLASALEERLAAFKGVEAALAVQSGWEANVALLTAIAGPGDLVLLDELDHRSTVFGARASGAEVVTYPHQDVDSLEGAIRDALRRREGAPPGRVVVATDGVFGIDGDLAPLPAICEVADAHGATVVVDDCHGTGVVGRDGRGTVDHLGVEGRVAAQVGSLSKALACMGGVLLGDRSLVDRLRTSTEVVAFSTLAPPAILAAASAALDISAGDAERRARMWRNARAFRTALVGRGVEVAPGETPITTLVAGERADAVALHVRLMERGIRTSLVTHPAVPAERSRVRGIVTSDHDLDRLDAAATAIAETWHALGLGRDGVAQGHGR
jgi:7-keto-8-aminopelargonate synthetase-like enzyme